MSNNDKQTGAKSIIAGAIRGFGGDPEAPLTLKDVVKLVEWHEQEIARLNALELKEK